MATVLHLGGRFPFTIHIWQFSPGRDVDIKWLRETELKVGGFLFFCFEGKII